MWVSQIFLKPCKSALRDLCIAFPTTGKCAVAGTLVLARGEHERAFAVLGRNVTLKRRVRVGRCQSIDRLLVISIRKDIMKRERKYRDNILAASEVVCFTLTTVDVF